MKILHISDIHYREHYEPVTEGYLGVVYGMTSPLVHLEKCFSSIELSDIDGVVVTGDLTENGSARDYQLLHAFLNDRICQVPMLVTLGNHDNKNAFREGWCNQHSTPGQDVPYNETVIIAGKLFISIDNSNSLYPNGGFTTDQIQWLEGTLKENHLKEIILIFHHNLIQVQKGIPAADPIEGFFELVSKYHVGALLCGHTHHHYQGLIGNIPYSTPPSMSFRGCSKDDCGIVEFEEYPGFQIIDFSSQGLTITPFYLVKEPRFIQSINIGEIKI